MLLLNFIQIFCVKDRATNTVLLHGRSRNGLYLVPSDALHSSKPSPRAYSSTRASSALWHHRLGHPSSRVVESIVRENKLSCASSRESLVCGSCQQAKVHKLSFPVSTHITTAPLEYVHSDVWGAAITSVGGFKYYISFLDDFSRFTWIYLLKRKSDVEHAFFLFQKHVERHLDAKICVFQFDWGGEYRRLSPHLANQGIQHHATCPHTSQQNGIAERQHRHVVETGIALLAHSSLPFQFWDEAFLTACYLINRMSTCTLYNSTPIESLLCEQPNYSFLRAFGYACWSNL